MQNPLMMALLFSKMAHPPAPQSNSTNSTSTTSKSTSNTNSMLQMMMLMKGNSMGGSSSPLLQSMLGGMSSVSPWSAPSSRSLDTAGSTSSSAASANNALMMSLLTNMMAANNNGGGGGRGGGGGGGGGGGKAGRRRNRQRAGKPRQRQMQMPGMGMGQGLSMQAPGQMVMQQRSAPMAAAGPAAAGAAGSPASMLGLSQNDLSSTAAQLGGQAGIDAIYAQLGGKDAVMRMIQSGQGLPPGFQMPAAILNLGSKVNPGAATPAAGSDSYDYEYYDPTTGAILPPLTPQTFTQYPSIPPPSTRNTVPQQQSTVQQRSTAPQQQSTVPSTQDAKAAASGLINAVGGQQALTSVYDSLGGQSGIDAIYNSLGGRDAVMKMIQSGQGLPAGFKLPQQLVDLRSKLDTAAKTESGAPAGGSYDYEYYYVDSNGNDISGASAIPPPAAAASSPVRVSPTSARVAPTAAPMPSFAPPDQNLVAGGGSLFDFLDNEDNDDVTLPSQKSTAAPSPSVASAGKGKKTTANATTLSDRLAAAQDRVIGGR